MTETRPSLDAIGEFKHSVWRSVAQPLSKTGQVLLGQPAVWYPLTEAQVDEIANEAAELVKGAVADERERCRRIAVREAAKCAGTIAGNALYDLADLLTDTEGTTT
jgi:hypothetical protein